MRERDVLEVYPFRIRVGMLQEEPLSPEAGICWKRAVPTSGYRYGAVIRESSKGWLGSHP